MQPKIVLTFESDNAAQLPREPPITPPVPSNDNGAGNWSGNCPFGYRDEDEDPTFLALLPNLGVAGEVNVE